MARNVTGLLAAEHRRLQGLATRACRGRGPREGYRDELVAAATAHTHAVTTVVLPFARLALPDHPLSPVVDAQEALRRAAVELAGTPAQHPRYAPRVAAVSAAAAQEHAAVAALLDRVASGVEVSRLRELGAAYLRSRDGQRRTHPGLGHRASPARATPRRLDVPRAALYEQARRAGIPGRSAMNRDQLIAALQEQGAGDP